MQVDSEQTSQAPYFINYFDVSSNFPWTETRSNKIEQRRALLGDTLIFDLLLSSGGVRQPDALYPPTDVSTLHQLLDAIENSQYDTLKKECLVYYLLKWHQDGREERFQLDRCIPPHFAALADAYWLLDAGVNVALAVSFLSDARINQDHVSKVLQSISLAPNPSPLIVKYVRTARPALTEPRDLDSYIIALAESCGLCDAWEFQRTFSQTGPSRPRLFIKILEWSVTPKSKPAALKQLLFLPLIPFEESLLRSFALEPPSTLSPVAIAALQDLICIRLIQLGRYTDAIKTDHEFTASTSNLLKGLSSERTKMIQDLYSSLPIAERLLLDEELKQANQQPASGLPTSKSGGDISLSSSWEDVRIMRSPSSSPGKLAHIKALNRDTQRSPKSISEWSLPKKSLANIQLPLIPTSGTPPKPVARKSFPLSFVSTTTPTVSRAPAKPRHSAGYVTTASMLDVPRSVVPTKSPQHPYPPSMNGTLIAGSAFSSASRSKNAFYEPPSKPKGAEASRAENRAAEPEAPVTGHRNDDADTDMAEEPANEEHPTVPNLPELEFSIFADIAEEHGTISNGFHVASPEQGKRKRVPPGAFMSDEEDGMEKDDVISTEPIPSQRRSWSPSIKEENPSPTMGKKSTRPRHSTAIEVQQLKQSIPGSLMMDEDDEEEDHVAPLKQPSPPRRMRKKRSSTSSDVGEDLEAPQTRRRSSRLSNQMNILPDESPKKPSASTKTRKSTKSSSSTKKRR